MKTLLAILIWLFPAIGFAQTFGLGEDPPVETATAIESGQTFGLGDSDSTRVAPPRASVSMAVAQPVFVQPAKRIVSAAPYQSPPGFHRHITTSGVVVEHSDSNFGNPIAHAGIASPWPKYFGPAAPSSRVNQSSCPGGICPPNVSVRNPRQLFRRSFR